MAAIERVAIVGSGVTGLTAAIMLARAGIQVDVFEAKPELPAIGSGLSLQGNAIRVLDALGVWEDLRAESFPFDGLSLRAPGPQAPVIADFDDIKTGGPDYPAAMGIYRPALAAALLRHAQAAGANVRFGARITALTSAGDTVRIEIDGVADPVPADLVIGADGINSTVRDLIGIEVGPQPTGMGIWRASVSRPPEVEHTELYYGGPVYIAGYTPTGQDAMYAFLVEPAQDRFGLDEAESRRIMLEESLAYGGPWDSIRADLATASVNYTWFTQHLLPAPWNRGRIVVIGDAAHSCPPTIAQGAAQGIEDAYVLGELLLGAERLDDELWTAFHARRLPRVERVVEASVQLGQWQIDGVRDADTGGLIFGVAHAMAEPA